LVVNGRGCLCKETASSLRGVKLSDDNVAHPPRQQPTNGGTHSKCGEALGKEKKKREFHPRTGPVCPPSGGFCGGDSENEKC